MENQATVAWWDYSSTFRLFWQIISESARSNPVTNFARERKKKQQAGGKNRNWKRKKDPKLGGYKRLESKDVNYGLNDQYDA